MRRRAFLQSSAGAVSLPLLGTVSARDDTKRVGSQQVGSIENQESYEPYASIEIDGAREAAVHNDGDIAYIAADTGVVSVDISDPENPEKLDRLDEFDTESDMEHSGSSVGGYWDVWPDGDRLVFPGPTLPNPGRAQGFALLDISDPGSMEQVAWYPTEYYIHNSFFEDGIVYLTGSGLERKPIIMVDVTDDDPQEVGRWSLADYVDNWEELAASVSLHDVYVYNEVAYLPYWDTGTWMVDVSDPSDPEVLSRVGNYTLDELKEMGTRTASEEFGIPPGNDHYAEVNEDETILVVGKEAWAEEPVYSDELIGGAAGVDLYDVSDKTDPQHLAHIEPPESVDQTDSGWYTTAHNADIAGDRLYTSWYYGGVKVHDISDPSNPEELVWWRNPIDTCFWTAQVAKPGETFVASSFDSLAPPVGGGLTSTRFALYTFPDRAGEQADPIDLTDPPAAVTDPTASLDDDTPTATPTPEPTATETETTPSPTETGDESTPESTATATATEEGDGDGSGPGFTAGGALAGLGGAYYLLRRRLSDEE